jgi:hypothetical protein
MNTIKAISRGVRAALKPTKPQKFDVADRGVMCSHCGGKDFKRHDLFKSFGVPFSRHAYGLECAACHHLELFANPIVEVDAAQPEHAISQR